jgi:precorrin-2/cobalt-factor-2 C20-methyltransferase
MAGTLFTVGLGPGDPELMTLKAARIIAAAPVVAFFAKRGGNGNAHAIAASCISPDAEQMRLEYPFTTEVALADPRYLADIGGFYEDCATRLATKLETGLDVALLCEGDPFFYGSSMHLFDRLGGRYRGEVVPGVPGMSGCWTRALTPIAHGDDVLTVLPGTLDEDRLVARLEGCDAAVIMKVGRNLPKIQAALVRAGVADRAIYVERGTMSGERILPLAAMAGQTAPYFSLILIPGRQRPR